MIGTVPSSRSRVSVTLGRPGPRGPVSAAPQHPSSKADMVDARHMALNHVMEAIARVIAATTEGARGHAGQYSRPGTHPSPSPFDSHALGARPSHGSPKYPPVSSSAMPAGQGAFSPWNPPWCPSSEESRSGQAAADFRRRFHQLMPVQMNHVAFNEAPDAKSMSAGTAPRNDRPQSVENSSAHSTHGV
jgi:hypothetical protein